MGRAAKLHKYDSSFLATYKAKYLGMSLSRSGVDAKAIRLAAALVKRGGRERSAKVHMTMRVGNLTLTDRSSGDILFTTGPDSVTWSGVDQDSQDHVVVVVKTEAAAQAQIRFYCHVIQLGKVSLMRDTLDTLDAAFGGAGRGGDASDNGRLASVPATVGGPTGRIKRNQSASQVYPAPNRRSMSESSTGSLELAAPSTARFSAGAQAAMIAQRHRLQQQQLQGRRPSDGSGDRRGSVSQMRRASVAAGPSASKFRGIYLGSMKVTQLFGAEPLQAAYRSLLAEQPESEGCMVLVTPFVVQLLELTTGAKMVTAFVKNVSYSCILDRSDGGDVFGFISVDQHLGTNHCHLLRMQPGGGSAVHSAINNAFQMLAAEEKARGDDPFRATDPKREAVPGQLFQRQIHRGHLKALRQIGAGQFGSVFVAIQTVKEGTGERGGNTIKRAVKLLKNAASSEDKKAFLMESETMLKLRHPNLITIKGVALQQKPWLCVLEYMEHGDLQSVMVACREKSVNLRPGDFLNFGVQLAAGMSFLAGLRLVHMDLAARNALLTAGNVVKVGDFGLTRPMDPGQDHLLLRVPMRLALKWLSTEGMDKKLFSEKSDVWSFGITMWELFSYGRAPYGKVKTTMIQKAVREGLRLSCPAGCPQEVWALLCSCWLVDPTDRPTFAELQTEITKLMQIHPPGEDDIGRLVQAVDAPQDDNAAGLRKNSAANVLKSKVAKARAAAAAKQQEEEFGFGRDFDASPPRHASAASDSTMERNLTNALKMHRKASAAAAAVPTRAPQRQAPPAARGRGPRGPPPASSKAVRSRDSIVRRGSSFRRESSEDLEDQFGFGEEVDARSQYTSVSDIQARRRQQHGVF